MKTTSTPTLTTQQRAQAAFESIAAGLKAKDATTKPVTFSEDDTSPQARTDRHYLGLAKQLKKGINTNV